jgi:hypothetical protein
MVDQAPISTIEEAVIETTVVLYALCSDCNPRPPKRARIAPNNQQVMGQVQNGYWLLVDEDSF